MREARHGETFQIIGDAEVTTGGERGGLRGAIPSEHAARRHADTDRGMAATLFDDLHRVVE